MTEEGCVDACSVDRTCQGANFNTKTKVCELHTVWKAAPTYTGDVNYWIAFLPVAQR
ncbi:hypothetical protein BDV39DRAFT_171754 [Aspergillus sergii]|uniref:Apple domain-containing protein n=1 Tax=Aspergillus sergii TaxID=1034303 RepID=A0A5N6X807_9EURO|nr:hypothetical protein BDV39DRAFT_171754 [Aspergillus sergii]